MLCGTVQATDERWETSWDDLIDEMHQISKKAILDVLKPESNWTVPLSSGLDSRLIATIGAEEGVNLRTYTWGPKSPTRDVVYSKKISQVLGLPWKNVELGDQYLTEYVKQWADMFGSAMHFHGMYQFPFLNALRSEPIGKIVSGFVGDSLGGYDTLFQTNYHTPNQRTYYALPPTWAFWRAEELKQLFKFPIDDSLEQLADEILRLKNNVSGPWFQRLRFLTLWGRQNHFTYFQSMLSDYWFGVATPYINRTYARFCLSLPRAVLDERRLQLDMMRRYYPKIMSIPGTYALDPAVFTGSFLLKRRLANFLPEQLNRWIFPEFAAARKFLADIASIRSGKRRAIWPIEETRNNLDTWMDINLIDRVYQAALDGDMPSVRKLQSVQAIAYRIASNNNEK